MNNVWQKQYALRAGDFDRFDQIKPSAVLDLFQDAAGQHAEELGVGFAQMLARSYLWVLVRIRFRIIKAPVRYQDVRVKTWPLEPNRLSYRREYCITDENEEVLIIGTSEWVVMHSEKRRLLSVPDLYPFTSGFCEDVMFEGKLGKVQDFEASAAAHSIAVRFCDLDINGHVNNTKYADYALDALESTGENMLQEFQIDYRKEVYDGMLLNIYAQKADGQALIKGENADGETMFACSLQYR